MEFIDHLLLSSNMAFKVLSYGFSKFSHHKTKIWHFWSFTADCKNWALIKCFPLLLIVHITSWKKHKNVFAHNFHDRNGKIVLANISCIMPKSLVSLYPVSLHLVSLYPVPLYPVSFYPVFLYPVSFYPVSLYPVLLYPVSLYPVSLYPVSLYPVSLICKWCHLWCHIHRPGRVSSAVIFLEVFPIYWKHRLFSSQQTSVLLTLAGWMATYGLFTEIGRASCRERV